MGGQCIREENDEEDCSAGVFVICPCHGWQGESGEGICIVNDMTLLR